MKSLFLLKSMRWGKNFPLLLLFFSGIFAAGQFLMDDTLIVDVMVILCSSAFMTQLNIITDRELDKSCKPHLFAYLIHNRELTTVVMTLEFVLAIGGIGWLLGKNYWQPGLGLLGFTLFTILYSYNFFSLDRPESTRWKTTWWGHAGTVIPGYFCLWFAGYSLAGGNQENFLRYWGVIFLIISCSEYALFLSESAIDSYQELQKGFRNTVAILGKRKSSALALDVSVGILVIFFVFIFIAVPASERWRIFWAYIPAMLIRIVILYILQEQAETKSDQTLREKLPDRGFISGRLLTTATLAFL